MTTPGALALTPPPAERYAGQAWHAAIELAGAIGDTDRASHHDVVADMARSVSAINGTLHHGAALTRDPGTAASLRAAAATAAAAGPYLATAAMHLPEREQAGAAGPGTPLREAWDRLLAELRDGAPVTDPASLAQIAAASAGTLECLAGAAEQAAGRVGPPEAFTHLHGAAFLLRSAAAPAGDARTRLHLSTDPDRPDLKRLLSLAFDLRLPRIQSTLAERLGLHLPDPSRYVIPPRAEIAAHVRGRQAAALYQNGKPPRDEHDRSMFTAMARADLEQAWAAELARHVAGPDHASCAPGGCRLENGLPDTGPEAAEAATWLAGAARERGAALPQADRAARALSQVTGPQPAAGQPAAAARRPAAIRTTPGLAPQGAAPARRGVS